MTNRARELLERALRDWEDCESILDTHLLSDAMEEIREYLANEEPDKRGPLSDEEIVAAYEDSSFIGTMTAFVSGVSFAEKHHGIQVKK